MNTLKLNKLTYKFQDLLLQKRMPTLKSFKLKVCEDFFIPVGQLKKIYAFIGTMQQHPRKYLLVHPLSYVFKMVLNDMFSAVYSKKYLTECIKVLRLRPNLLGLTSSNSEKPDTYVLCFPLLKAMFKINSNIFAYFFTDKVFRTLINDMKEKFKTKIKNGKEEEIVVLNYIELE